METTNTTADRSSDDHPDEDAESLDAEEGEFAMDSHLASLKAMDPADSPSVAEAIADHLMRELNANSAPGGSPAS